MIFLKSTSGRPLARPDLLGPLASAAMVLVLNSVANAADGPKSSDDTVQILKAPPPPPAASAPGHYQFGDFNLAVSGVATIGTAIRTTNPDPRLVPPQNGRLVGITGRAVGGANADDGNLNWRAGSPVSSVVKTFVTIDANYKDMIGVFARAMTWYDYTLANQGVPWGNTSGGYLSGGPLSERGWDSRARSSGIAPQEIYAYAKHRVGDVALEGRAGDILVPWGLPTMIPGGFAMAVNAVDYAALNRPGAQPEEIFAPTPGAWARIGLFDRATIEAFTLFSGPRSTLPGCGTLYSGADWVAPGCDRVVFGPNADPLALATGLSINRDPTPSNHDAQFGVGGSYVAAPIGTKFGAYYSHVDNPTSTAVTVTSMRAAPLFIPNAPGNPSYFEQYAPGVDSFALNFTTQIQANTLYGEYVYKPNAPVQYNAADVLNALLSPVAPTQLRALYAAAPPGTVINAYDRLQVGNLVLGDRQVLPGVLGAKSLVLSGEFAAKSVYDLPDPSVRRYGRIDVFGLGPVQGVPNGGCTATTPAYQCSLDGYVSSFAWGYKLASSLRYENVFGSGVDVTPTIGLSHDVGGWSYDGVFNQGRVVLNVKLRAEFAKKFFAEVAWNPALRVATYDSMSDRQVFLIAAGMRF